MLDSDYQQYLRFVATVNQNLGVPDDYEQRTGLTVQVEPEYLQAVGLDIFGRIQRLSSDAARQFLRLCQQARGDGVNIGVVSGFRSVQYQIAVIERKLARGEDIATILLSNAAPGYSQHHSGLALDLTDLDGDSDIVLQRSFEQSDVFKWLTTYAEQFNFVMSYPEDNVHGITYEPWHWAYDPDYVSQ